MNVTNKVARLRVDIPVLDWKIGDQVCIKQVDGEGEMRTAFVEHAELGNTLSNLALDMLELEPDDSPVAKKLAAR